MKNKKDYDFDLTAKELGSWLKQELIDIQKAHELRTKEIKAILRDSESGKDSPRETSARQDAYDKRWGDALPGARAYPGMTDAEILSDVDNARKKDAPTPTWLKRAVKTHSPREK